MSLPTSPQGLECLVAMASKVEVDPRLSRELYTRLKDDPSASVFPGCPRDLRVSQVLCTLNAFAR